MTRTVVMGSANSEQNVSMKLYLEHRNPLYRRQTAMKSRDMTVSQEQSENEGFVRSLATLGHGVGIRIHENRESVTVLEVILPENAVITIEPESMFRDLVE